MSSNNENSPLVNNNNRNTPTDSQNFHNILETLLVLLFFPVAFGTIKLAHLIVSDPPVWALLSVLGFVVGIVLLLVPPKQTWTAVTLGIELTVVTVVVPETPPHTVLVLASCTLWLLFIFLVLSIRGVKRSEMGYLGTLVDAVEVGIGQPVFDIFGQVKGMVHDFFDAVRDFFDRIKGIALIILGGLGSAWGKLWGIAEASQHSNVRVDIEAGNEESGSVAKVYPPPYQDFRFSDPYAFSKG